MKVRILGCGPSSGVPRIGNDWGECDPGEARNRRTRCSILFESGGKRLLVDCGPDLRHQLLAAEVGSVDGVLVTHDHADHVHGIDDLRPIAADRNDPIPLYARRMVHDKLARRFPYVFDGAKHYSPTLLPVELEGTLEWGGATMRFVDQPHGGVDSLGVRADGDGRSFVYAIDFSDLTPDMASLYKEADLWICAVTPANNHPTHAGLDSVLGWASELRAGQLLLTNLDKRMDYATLAKRLPDWAAPAYDGLEIEF